MILKRLDQFLFFPFDPRILCIGRSIFYLAFLYFRGWCAGGLESVVNYPNEFWHPVIYLIPFPRWNFTLFEAKFITFSWYAALLFSLFGLFTKFATKSSFFLSLFILGYQSSFGKVDKSTCLPLIIAGILAFSRCGEVFSLDCLLRNRTLGLSKKELLPPSAVFGWPIRFIQVILAVTYFEAGVMKLKLGGSQWVSGENIGAILLSRPSVTPLGVWFASCPTLCRIGGLGTVLSELSGIVSIFVPRLRWFAIVVLSVMHVMNCVLMGRFGHFQHFLMNVVCFYFWLPKLATPIREKNEI